MYQVIYMYDGCPSNSAAPPYDTVAECKVFMRDYMERKKVMFQRDPKLELAIKDLVSDRLISYVL